MDRVKGMMIEFQVYGSIYAILLLVMLLFIIPRSVKEHYSLVKRVKLGQPLPEPASESGVSTSFVNISDVLSIILILFLAGLSLVQFAEPVAEIPEISSTTSITFDKMFRGLVFQVVGIGVVLCIMGFRVNLAEQFGISLRNIKKSLKYIFLTLTGAWGFTALIIEAGYFEFLNELLGTQPLQSAVIFLKESNDYLLISLLAICACIGAPLVEELIFRAYLYPIAKHYGGVPLGIFFSALFFSLIHFNFAAMPTLFVMGSLLAFSYEKTKTLWAPVLTHFIFNAVTVCMQILARFYDISPPV